MTKYSGACLFVAGAAALTCFNSAVSAQIRIAAYNIDAADVGTLQSGYETIFPGMAEGIDMLTETIEPYGRADLSAVRRLVTRLEKRRDFTLFVAGQISSDAHVVDNDIPLCIAEAVRRRSVMATGAILRPQPCTTALRRRWENS